MYLASHKVLTFMSLLGIILILLDTVFQILLLPFGILPGLLLSLQLCPFHLPGVLILTCLGLHRLDLNCVRLAAPHVQLVVANAQCKDALVDAQARGVEHKVLQQHRNNKQHEDMQGSDWYKQNRW